jgi:hypothetical protein
LGTGELYYGDSSYWEAKIRRAKPKGKQRQLREAELRTNIAKRERSQFKGHGIKHKDQISLDGPSKIDRKVAPWLPYSHTGRHTPLFNLYIIQFENRSYKKSLPMLYETTRAAVAEPRIPGLTARRA